MAEIRIKIESFYPVVDFIEKSVFKLCSMNKYSTNGLRVWIPEYFIYILNRDVNIGYKIGTTTICGIEVLIGYENKVIVAHKDAPFYAMEVMELNLEQ